MINDVIRIYNWKGKRTTKTDKVQLQTNLKIDNKID